MRAERILVVTDEMEVGGSQRQIVHLLQGVKASGRDVSLLYFRKPSFLLDRIQAAGVSVQRIDKRGRVDLAFVLRLVRFLRRGRFDVVHCFSITAEMWVRLALYAVPRTTRLVSSVRGMSKDSADWHWRAKRWIVDGSAAVIANSLLAAEWVAERAGVAVRRFSIVNNGIEVPAERGESLRETTRVALGVPDGRLLVLFVGRLVALKNISLLLRAMALIVPTERPCLRLAGDGPERARIEQEIAERGLQDAVHLLGERDDVPALMSAADVFVLSSREEGLSNVILEAMGSGLPVVATAVGGTPELIEDGVCGHLVPDDDAAALAAALERLAVDHVSRQRLGRAARQRVTEQFSIDAMVGATLAIYDRCVRSEAARA
ncbi:glycosyltransferase [Tahibacter amnicola]|uniref:Glycosyltransferase n=1 Tax=Tahibacter amnicola TaxID=2976241 RepID=A0ABY6B9V5_9GAMM|nr:glycosyltransferase [Tahibacter amnicola]UXI66337.1 glycosyltransferase [Tahibacter amnicola]